MGTRPVATARIFSQGDFQQTGNPLDLVIQGTGFFQVRLPSGEERCYTRDGTFHLNAQGSMVTADGNVLEPPAHDSAGRSEYRDRPGRTVSVTLAGQSAAQQVGTIQLANFQNSGGLNPAGGNLFMATTASGDAITGAPGQTGLGTINQGFLEQSNVDIVKEMVNMIVAQRAL